MKHKRQVLKKLLAMGLIMSVMICSLNYSTTLAKEISSDSAITKAYEWLIANQNGDGSWGIGKAQSIVATTHVLNSMKIINENNDSITNANSWLNTQTLTNFDFMSRAIPFVSENKRNEMLEKILSSQNIDGGWGIYEGYESDIIDTCLVLDVLMSDTGYDNEIHLAVQYLISIQNENGSWGLLSGNSESLFATTLVRIKLLEYKQMFNVGISEVLEQSKKWLVAMKNTDGTFGENEENIISSILAYKALNNDTWEEVKDIPEKVALRQMDNGSWGNNAYITSLALDMRLSHENNIKVALNGIKIYLNGIETHEVQAREILEIVPSYTGRDVSVEIKINDLQGKEESVIRDIEGRYLWPAEMNIAGQYTVEAFMKNENGEIISSIRKDFVVLPHIQINKAYIEVTPGASKLNTPITPIIRMYVDGEANVLDDIDVSLQVIDSEGQELISSLVKTKAITGEGFIELGSFTPDTSNEGTYLIRATIGYKGAEIANRVAKYKVLEKINSIYTYDEDFDKGVMVGVNYEQVSHQLQLNKSAEIFPYIWIANATEGTLSKLDTRTGKEIARYRTGPDSNTSPSRTTVDNEGNCWVANRNNGTVVKVAISGGIDKNNNGQIDTSSDKNGNGIIEANEMLAWGQDEAIIVVANVGGYNSGPRGLAIDKENRLWVGLYNENKYVVLNASDGSKTGIEVKVNGSPYGAAIDSNGYLWSSGLHANRIEKIDTNNPSLVKTYHLNYPSYGIVVDKNGIVWSPAYIAYNAPLMRINPGNDTITYHYGNYGSYGRGVAVDGDGSVWVAYSNSNQIIKHDAQGKYLFTVNTNPSGRGPIGIGVDGDGNVWAVNQATNNATKIKSDGTILGYFRVGNGPYTYSDMTGFNYKNITAHEGTWSVVHEGPEDDYQWSNVSWHEKKPEGTDIIVSVRAANNLDGLLLRPFVQIENNVGVIDETGRFIQIEVKLKTSTLDTPILEQLAIGGFNSLPVANAGDDIITSIENVTDVAKVLLDGTGSYDPDGDKLTYKWMWNETEIDGPQPTGLFPEGTTKVTLVVNNGTLDSEADEVIVTVVGPNCLKTSISTDTIEYDAGESVNINITGENDSALSKEYGLTVDIVDKNGHTVTNIVKDMNVELLGSQKLDILRNWNIGTTMAGNYTVTATWKEKDKVITQNRCSITINPEGSIKNKVTTEKVEYNSSEVVNVTEFINNTSANSISKALTVKTTIVNPEGNIVWENSNSIDEIIPNNRVTLKSVWATEQYVSGIYKIVSVVYQSDEIVSQAETTIVIKESSGNLVGITGTINIEEKKLYPNDEVIIKAQISNTGNCKINNLRQVVQVIKGKNNQIIFEESKVIDNLDINETFESEVVTKEYTKELGDYLVIIKVVTEGQEEKLLSSTGYKVYPPYDLEISQVVRPRVLVYADDQNSINLAESILKEENIYYKVAMNNSEFIKELKTDNYNSYFMMATKHPLTGHDDELLADEIKKGKGLIISGTSNGDNLKNHEMIGGKFRGFAPKDRYEARFENESLIVNGKIQKVELTTGITLSQVVIGKNEFPTIIENTYGSGKVIYFAFDLTECSGNVKDSIIKSMQRVMPQEEVCGNTNEYEIITMPYTSIDTQVQLMLPEDVGLVWTDGTVNNNLVLWNSSLVGNQKIPLRVVLKYNAIDFILPGKITGYYILDGNYYEFEVDIKG